MKRIVVPVICFAAVMLFQGCIAGRDDSPIAYEGGEDDSHFESGTSDWFMHNKVERLPYSPLPPRSEDGSLPRSIGGYSLFGKAPTEGKDFRDGQKIFYVEEISKNRRMRVFSRDGTIFRVQAFTRLTDLETSDAKELKNMIREEFGPPNHEIPAEIVYVDRATVVLFSVSADFLVTDLMDVSTCELPVHIMALVENARE